MNDIQAGSTVQWTQTSRRGRTISMRVRTGVVESVENGVAVVTYGKQGRMHCAVARLSLVGQPTALDAVVTAIRTAAYGVKS